MRTPSNKRKTVLVDFDGTLTTYQAGWQGYHICHDPPQPGALVWLWKLCQLYDVKIVSGRAKTWRGRRCIRRWLKKHAGQLWPLFKKIHVTSKKVDDYVMFIDDRAYHFNGANYPNMKYILEFQPWCKK
jgi:hypothetical protein